METLVGESGGVLGLPKHILSSSGFLSCLSFEFLFSSHFSANFFLFFLLIISSNFLLAAIQNLNAAGGKRDIQSSVDQLSLYSDAEMERQKSKRNLGSMNLNVENISEVLVEWELDREIGLTLSAWDFPAGEIYTNRFFITDRAVYFVCFDANK
jgi:hypothetical protein